MVSEIESLRRQLAIAIEERDQARQAGRDAANQLQDRYFELADTLKAVRVDHERSIAKCDQLRAKLLAARGVVEAAKREEERHIRDVDLHTRTMSAEKQQWYRKAHKAGCDLAGVLAVLAMLDTFSAAEPSQAVVVPQGANQYSGSCAFADCHWLGPVRASLALAHQEAVEHYHAHVSSRGQQ